jgi:hypothetical protein
MAHKQMNPFDRVADIVVEQGPVVNTFARNVVRSENSIETDLVRGRAGLANAVPACASLLFGYGVFFFDGSVRPSHL